MVRAAFAAAPGYQLISADFSGVESRVLAWLAGEKAKLKLWSDFDAGGDDPYLVLGLRMGFPKETARATGKTGDLAFGFAGGKGAYRKFGDADASDAEIDRLKKSWRTAHPRSVALWYELERKALRAVANPKAVQRVNHHVAFCADETFLRMRLPSGRCLAYPFPRIEAGMKFGKPANILHYMDSAKGAWRDVRNGEGSWPGLLCENLVQAVARDLIAAAMQRLEAAGFQIVAHVHDEVVCELPSGCDRTEEVQRIMAELPDWAEGLPISAKVRSGPRFLEIENNPDTSIASEVAPDDDDDLEAEDEAPPIEDEEPEQAEAPRPSAPAMAPPSRLLGPRRRGRTTATVTSRSAGPAAGWRRPTSITTTAAAIFQEGEIPAPGRREILHQLFAPRRGVEEGEREGRAAADLFVSAAGIARRRSGAAGLYLRGRERRTFDLGSWPDGDHGMLRRRQVGPDLE